MLSILLPLAVAASQGGAPSAVHSKDALLYFEVADLQSVMREYRGSSYANALRDPECRTALEKLLRLEKGALEEPEAVINNLIDLATDQMWSKIQPNLAEVTTLSFSLHLNGMTPDQFLEGHQESGFWSSETLLQRVSDHACSMAVVDFTGTDFADGAFEFLAYFAEEAGEPDSDQSPSVELDGRNVRRLAFERIPGPELSFEALLDGNRLYFVLAKDPVAYVQSRLRDPNKISADVRFKNGRDKFGQSLGLTAFEYKSTLASDFFKICPEPEYIQPVLDLVVSALGPDIDMLIRGGQWRVQLRTDEKGLMFVTEAFQEDLNLGPFDQLFSKHPVHVEALDFVSEDAVVAGAMTIDQELLVSMIKHIFEDVDEDPFRAWDQKYGFRPEDDLLKHLGTTWISSMPESAIGVANLPGISFWIDLENKDAFIGGMQKLVRVIEGEAGDEVVLKTKQYRNHMLFTLKALDPDAGIEAMFQPSIAVFDNRILMTLSRSHAQKEIKRAAKSAKDLGKHPVFNSRSLPRPGITDMAYSDWAKVVGRLYTGAKGFLPMVTSNMPDDVTDGLPIDLNSLPDAKLFTKYFRPTLRYRDRISGGVRTYSQSSVGPEFSTLVTAAAGFGIGMFIPAMMYARAGEESLTPVTDIPKPLEGPK